MRSRPARGYVATLAAACCVGSAVVLTAGQDASAASARPYIVTARTSADAASLARTARARGISVTHVYRRVLPGFSARLTQDDVRRLRRDGTVVRVDADRAITPVQVERRASATGLWGLDRIDQRHLPLDGRIVTAGQGQGVAVYVIDSGIRADQVQFAGRMASGYAAVGNGEGAGDCNGHGTAVAGVIGGEITGVAPQVTLVPVRVLGCQATGLASSLIAGLDWMVGDHQQGVPAVANISMYGPGLPPLDRAVAASVADGVVVSVAAGNDGGQACDGSPAASPDAITTAATTPDDTVAPWSGWGPCVDISAPGSNVLTAAVATPTGLATAGGTSIASAFTAGAAAILLGLDPWLTPAAVRGQLEALATANVLTGLAPGTPNRLLYIGVPLAPGEQVAVAAPPGPRVLTGVTVAFRRAADGDSPVGRYQVRGRSTRAGQLTLTVAGRLVDRRRIVAGPFAYRTRIARRISVVRLVIHPASIALTTSSVRVKVRFPG